jgi:hypothetical protein
MTFIGNVACFKKRLNGIPNVTVWRVLRECIHLKAYKLSIVKHLGRWIVYTPLSLFETPCMYIRGAWLCKSAPFFPPRKQGYSTTQRVGANLQQNVSPAQFLNRLGPYCISATLCTGSSLRRSKSRLAANSSEKTLQLI